MDDLFEKYYASQAEEKRLQQTPPESPPSAPEDQTDFPGQDDPRILPVVANAFFDHFSVDEWVSSKSGQDTFEFNTPRGKLFWTKNRKAHKRLVAAGEVVFSPLEIERFVKMQLKDKLLCAKRLERGEDDGGPAINQALIDLIYATKRMDPGAKLDEIKLFESNDEVNE